jgi:hypothetical protein
MAIDVAPPIVPARRRRRLGAAGPLVLVVLLVASVVIPANGSSAFAGYTWSGQLMAVRGSWTVPAIRRGSPPGVAATWIGAQAPGVPGPFIQIGTTEQYTLTSVASDGLPSHLYFAFWSDVARHFHPVVLFPVASGDDLSASMSLAHGKWTLAIVDETSGESAQLTTTDEARASFNEAQWTQEDVTDGKTKQPFPYPQLTAVAFRRLAVNGQIPNGAALSPQSLSEHGSSVVPSSIEGDSFTLTQH